MRALQVEQPRGDIAIAIETKAIEYFILHGPEEEPKSLFYHRKDLREDERSVGKTNHEGKERWQFDISPEQNISIS